MDGMKTSPKVVHMGEWISWLNKVGRSLSSHHNLASCMYKTVGKPGRQSCAEASCVHQTCDMFIYQKSIQIHNALTFISSPRCK
jgi:hypothetical protein